MPEDMPIRRLKGIECDRRDHTVATIRCATHIDGSINQTHASKDLLINACLPSQRAIRGMERVDRTISGLILAGTNGEETIRFNQAGDVGISRLVPEECPIDCTEGRDHT